jgi:hypothetical protein
MIRALVAFAVVGWLILAIAAYAGPPGQDVMPPAVKSQTAPVTPNIVPYVIEPGHHSGHPEVTAKAKPTGINLNCQPRPVSFLPEGAELALVLMPEENAAPLYLVTDPMGRWLLYVVDPATSKQCVVSAGLGFHARSAALITQGANP